MGQRGHPGSAVWKGLADLSQVASSSAKSVGTAPV